MQISGGLRPDQVAQVRGFADQHLRTPKDPTNTSNRRISVIIQYLNAPPAAPPAEKPKAGVGEPHGEAGHESKPSGAKTAEAIPAAVKPPESPPVPVKALQAKKPDPPSAQASH
jgi:chemotaxis protein MotB